MPNFTLNSIRELLYLAVFGLWSCSATVIEPEERQLLSKPGLYPALNAPENLCEAVPVNDQSEQVLVPAKKPQYLKPYTDPSFGTRVTRITKSVKGDVHKPLYSTIQAWNADESLLMLFRRGFSSSEYVLLDGHTYEPRGRLTINPADVEEVFWSRFDPNRLFYVSRSKRTESQFFSYNTATGERSLIKDLAPMCQSGSVARSGGDVFMQSLDDDLFGFRCETPSGVYRLFSYRISTDELISVKANDGNDWNEWTAPMPSPSGRSMWLQGDVVNPQLNQVQRTLDLAKPGEHGDMGLGHDGQDTLYQTVFDPSPRGCDGAPDKGVGHLGIHDLNTGKCRAMLTESEGWPYTTSGTHVSAGAYKQPGWVALSSIGYREQLPFLENRQPATPLFSEIYVVNTNPNKPQVCRVAHHRSFGKFAQKGDYPAYFGEPHPSHSPTGTRIVFGSDWQDSGAVDSYVVELPSYKPPAPRKINYPKVGKVN